MRLQHTTFAAEIALLLNGTILLVVGLFAFQLGLDNNTNWGITRTMIVLGGCLNWLAVGFLHFHQQTGHFVHAIITWVSGIHHHLGDSKSGQIIQQFLSSFFSRLHRIPLIQKTSSVLLHNDRLFSVAGFFSCILIAIWFITAGRMVVWTQTTNYFDQLAEAFLAGQLSLIEQPSDELLAMTNPYDWQARDAEHVAVVWDASLYNGKYYLYWGPVPALLVTGLKSITQLRIDDSALVFLFYLGLMCFVVLTLNYLRRRFFPHSPAWLLMPLIMLGGLTAPMLCLLNRPNVYEVAIVSGQFFLIGGLYFALRAIDSRNKSGYWMLAAGISWGLSIGCRLNLALAIGFLVLAISVYWIKFTNHEKSKLPLILLILPLLICVTALGSYNYARFGSVMETGHRYQLTGDALPSDYSNVTSIKYVLPSLFSYLFRVPEVNPGEFPFVFIPYIEESDWPFFIYLPADYYSREPVAGLLMITPALLLIILPSFRYFRKFEYWLQNIHLSLPARPIEFTLLWVMLAGGSVLLFAPLLVFISTSLRYLADVLPVITLLIAFSLGWGLKFFDGKPGIQRLILFIAVILILVSIITGLCSGFTTGSTFKSRNPVLFKTIQGIIE